MITKRAAEARFTLTLRDGGLDGSRPLNRFNAHRVKLGRDHCLAILSSAGADCAAVQVNFGMDLVQRNMNFVFNPALLASFSEEISSGTLSRLKVLGKRLESGRATDRMVNSFRELLETCQHQSFPPPIPRPFDWRSFWRWSEAVPTRPKGRPGSNDLHYHQLILTLYECFFKRKRAFSPGPSMRFVIEFLIQGRKALDADYKRFGRPHPDVVNQLHSIWKRHAVSALEKRWSRSLLDEQNEEQGPNGERPFSLRSMNFMVVHLFNSPPSRLFW
jgi:hypothetical protein